MRGERQNQILAVLFASSEPVTYEELHSVFSDVPRESLEEEARKLCESFNALQDAVEIREVAGGLRITTRVEHHEEIRNYLKARPAARLSPAALETLAVIAYRQPITLPEIMEIRGIKGTSTIKTLMDKKLIETRGRKRVVGRPIMYGTTRDFLIQFGLQDLDDLPTLAEFEELIKQSDESAGIEAEEPASTGSQPADDD